MKDKAIICDLDGTLVANNKWDGTFETFYDTITECYPVDWCLNLLQGLHKQKVKIIFMTARGEHCKNITKIHLNSWLDFPYELYMRKQDDIREDHIVKRDYTEELLKKYDILLALDDNIKNCQMFRSYGITALLVC